MARIVSCVIVVCGVTAIIPPLLGPRGSCMLRASFGTGTGGLVLLRTLIRVVGMAAAAVMLMMAPARAVTEIQWWHAMPGELGRQVEKLAADFNASQTEYRIVPTYKGLYAETMTVALFTFRARQHPAIVQV